MANCEETRNGYRCKCEECGEFFERERPASKCLKCRTVYESRTNRDPFVEVGVNGESYFIMPCVHILTKPQPTRLIRATEWEASQVFPSMDMENLAKKLSHMKPNITKGELTKLFQDAILKGVFQPLGSFDSKNVLIGLTVDSWLKLERKNENSKWVAVTQPQVQSLLNNQAKILQQKIEKAGWLPVV